MDGMKTRLELTSTGKSINLPQEIIEEIMSALPAKSLLKFRCVSKSWGHLINSEKFIKTQLEKSIKDPSYAHCRVVFNCKYDRDREEDEDKDPEERPGLMQCSAESFIRSYNNHLDRRPFDDSTNNHLTTIDCDIVGHCNGLLCIKKGLCFFLWNPTTRISIELPKLNVQEFYIEKYGFGMDEQSGAYKVYVVLPKDEDEDEDEDEEEEAEEDWCMGKVYSSETKSWKKVQHGCLRVDDEAGVLVGGKLHWLTLDGDYIESFDLGTEVFERIELPYKKTEAKYYFLGVSRGMLRVVMIRDRRFETWVRVTKGGAKDHWVKEGPKGKNIMDDCWEMFYVESLVWPISLKNH